MTQRFLDHFLGVLSALATIEAGGVGPDLVAKRAAHQAVNRLAQRLAGEIPECDVDRGDAEQRRPFLTVGPGVVVHRFPQHLAVENRAPDHQRLERMLDHRLGDLWRLQSVVDALPPAHQAVIGMHFHQHRRALMHPALGERKRLLQRRGEDVSLEVSNDHGKKSLCEG